MAQNQVASCQLCSMVFRLINDGMVVLAREYISEKTMGNQLIIEALTVMVIHICLSVVFESGIMKLLRVLHNRKLISNQLLALT